MKYTREAILKNKRKTENQKELEEVFAEFAKPAKKEEKKADASKK